MFNTQVSKRLRLVQKHYETYTGPIGTYEFVDGVSIEAIPLSERDRIAVAFECNEVEEDGSGERRAGANARLVEESATRAPVHVPLEVMTEEEKVEEGLRAILEGEEVPYLHSVAALEKVADKGGIQDLRAIANLWGARSKSIPDLISKISEAQAKYSEIKIDELLKKGVQREEAASLFKLNDEPRIPEIKKLPVQSDDDKADFSDPENAKPVVDEERVLQSDDKADEFSGQDNLPGLNDTALAAASGDLAAALSVEKPQE